MTANTNKNIVTIQFIKKPERKIIILRSKQATDYFSYCEEMGCDWEGLLNSIPEKLGSAAIMNLPKQYVTEGTSEVVSGVEVPINYDKELPNGYEMLTLPACEVIQFQGVPYEDEETFCEMIDIVEAVMEQYNPEPQGYKYDFTIAPKINYGAPLETGVKQELPVKKM